MRERYALGPFEEYSLKSILLAQLNGPSHATALVQLGHQYVVFIVECCQVVLFWFRIEQQFDGNFDRVVRIRKAISSFRVNRTVNLRRWGFIHAIISLRREVQAAPEAATIATALKSSGCRSRGRKLAQGNLSTQSLLICPAMTVAIHFDVTVPLGLPPISMMLCLGIFGNRRPARFAHRPTLRPSAGFRMCAVFFGRDFSAFRAYRYGHRLSPQEALGYKAQGLRDYGTVTGWKGNTVAKTRFSPILGHLVTFRSLLKCSVPTLIASDIHETST